MDFPGRVIAAFITLILIVVFPLQYLAQSSDHIISSRVNERTRELTDAIRDKGYIDKEMYERYLEELDISGDIYRIEIQDIRPVSGSLLYAETKSFINVSSIRSKKNELIKTEDLDVSGLATESLRYGSLLSDPFSQEENQDEIESFAIHTHNADCYAGHRHVNSCYAWVGNRDKAIRLRMYKMSGSSYAYTSLTITCQDCGGIIYGANYIDYFNETYSPDYVDLNGRTYSFEGGRYDNGYQTFSRDRYSWKFDSYIQKFNALYEFLLPFCDTYDYQNYHVTSTGINIPANQWPTVPYFYTSAAEIYPGCLNPSAPQCYTKVQTTYCGQVQDENLICNQVVTGITPTYPNQTINANESIITTAKATYMDGHTGTVNCASNFDLQNTGNQLVTLTYSGLVGNAKTSGTRTCTVNVTRIQSNGAHVHTTGCYTGHRHYSDCLPAGYLGGEVYFVNVPKYVVDAFQPMIYCARCKKQIASISTNFSKANLNCNFNYYGFNSSGTIVHYLNGGTTGYNGNPNASLFDSYVNTYSRELDGLISPYKVEGSSTTRTFNFMDVIGIYSWYTTDAVYHTLPYMGCPYCGVFGQNYSCHQIQDETPICNRVVTNITPTDPVQTVTRNEQPKITAIATYLDGHTDIVNCTSNFNPNLEGTQKVTLTYTGLVGNAQTTGTRTCTMSVTVISKTLQSISVTPTEQIINKNGLPTFTVQANYTDDSSIILASEKYSVSAFDASVPGEKTITISYTEGTITKTATVKVYVDDLKSITASPAILTVEKYTDQTMLSILLTASYLYSSDKTITGGYNISGYTPDIMGEQRITISYTENGTTRTTQITINVTGLHKTCPKCGIVYELREDDSDPGCPVCKNTIVKISVTPEYVEVEQGHELPITVLATYADGSANIVSGWTSDFIPEKAGIQNVTVEYGGFMDEISVWVSEAMITCPICQVQHPISEGKCPVCSETVVKITVTPAAITVHRYDTIDLTVIADFADRSSRPVTDWSIDKTTTEEGTYTATVSYENVTTTVTLTVLPTTTITCPVCGLLYGSGEYPNGCPVCSTTLTGIEAYLTSGAKLVQFGSTPSIAIVEIYQDTHREVSYDGYTIEGYKPYILGEQTITINYETFSTTIDIEVVNSLNSVTCTNGHVYFLNEDGSDPGCPYCESSEGLEEAVFYYDITYTDEILDAIYTVGIYIFDKSNYVTLCVTKKDKSLITRVQNTFFKTAMLGRKKRYIYGGKVC